MKKTALIFLAFLLSPIFASAQIFNQSQIISTPYNGWIVSTSTGTGAKLGASSSPFFSNGFNFTNATGTNATTSNLFTTAFYATGLVTCNSANSALLWSGGVFGCTTISGGSGSPYPFQLTGNATSTLTLFNGGLQASASSTLNNFTFFNATGTQATTTNFFSTNIFGTNANFSSGLVINGGTSLTTTNQTGSGSIVLATGPTLSNPIVGTQTASDNSTKAASTAYVTTGIANAIAGVNPAVAVQAATTAASDTSGLTYNNGVGGIGAFFTGSVNTAITIDGYTFNALNQRLLVKNDTQSPSGAFNGIYYLSTLQGVAAAPIFTRALDYDMPSDINNTGTIPVVNGTANALTSWLLTSSVTTVGTDPLTYVKFSNSPSSQVTSVTATYPIQSTGGQTPVISTAFGTTTNNLFSGTNIFQNSTTTIVGGLTIGGNATVTSATTTGSLNVGLYLSGASLTSCTGTNALTWVAGQFGCSAVPQGTVTSVATGNGLTGGAITGAGTLSQDFTFGGTYTGANIFNNITRSTTTQATTTNLFVNTLNFVTGSTTNLTAIGSTTLQNFTGVNATTSQATTTNITVSGKNILINTGLDAAYITGTTSPSFNIASSTLDAMGKSFSIGTTTLLLKNFPQAFTLNGFYCMASSTNISAMINFSHDNGNKTEYAVCTSTGNTPTYNRVTTNNTWTTAEDFNVQASSTSPTTPINRLTITVVGKYTSN